MASCKKLFQRNAEKESLKDNPRKSAENLEPLRVFAVKNLQERYVQIVQTLIALFFSVSFHVHLSETDDFFFSQVADYSLFRCFFLH